jgi:dephospho-CoA kinase
VLRVGLTGGLGSGKSTVARQFARRGAHVLESDEIGRQLMQPGQPVYEAIVKDFGAGVVCRDGTLDRKALARLAFEEGRVEELNAIVHPAVIARQAELVQEICAKEPHAIVVVESALIFETKYGETKYSEKGHESEPWKSRFDCIVLVTAFDEVKIERFIQRAAGAEWIAPERRAELRAEARRRLAQQIPDEKKIPLCDFVLENDGPLEDLELQINQLWPVLQLAAAVTHAMPGNPVTI